MLEGREHTFLWNERKNGHGFFFFLNRCIQKFKQPQKEERSVVPCVSKQRKAAIPWKLVYSFFSKTFLKSLKHENNVCRIQLKEKGRTPSWWCGRFLHVGQSLDCLAIGWLCHARWCKEAFTYYPIKIFGEAVENTYREKRLCTCLLK